MATTTVSVRPPTLKRLRSYKVNGTTYDDVLNDLMDENPPRCVHPRASAAAAGGTGRPLDRSAQAAPVVSLRARGDPLQVECGAGVPSPPARSPASVHARVRVACRGTDAAPTRTGHPAASRHEGRLASARRGLPGNLLRSSPEGSGSRGLATDRTYMTPEVAPGWLPPEQPSGDASPLAKPEARAALSRPRTRTGPAQRCGWRSGPRTP